MIIRAYLTSSNNSKQTVLLVSKHWSRPHFPWHSWVFGIQTPSHSFFSFCPKHFPPIVLGGVPIGLGDLPIGLGDLPIGLGDLPNGLGELPSGLGGLSNGLGGLSDGLGGLSDGLGGLSDGLGGLSNGLGGLSKGLGLTSVSMQEDMVPDFTKYFFGMFLGFLWSTE